ncbi:MAG: S-adenosylmethionine:tRNA ribosyltransferase-isomerase, partial [Lachnospiraceae bacterium]|nr:S-adenosylmethionine:tRNA ribosyltransferase-isomerase [Lachnospiraceae bacterium]
MTEEKITGLKTADYYYELPERLIAQDPLRDRSSSRLMVLHKETGEIEHKTFTDILDYLEAGDCLVLNDTRVIPARLIGTRVPKGSDGTHLSGGGRFHEGGSAAEILLLKRLSENTWETIVHPGKKLREGDVVVFGEGKQEGPAPLTATIKEVLPDGNRIVEFAFDGIWEEVLNELGEMPLPPYIT